MTNKKFSVSEASETVTLQQHQAIDNSGLEEIEYPRLYGKKTTCEDCGYRGIEDGMPECPRCHVKLLWFPPQVDTFQYTRMPGQKQTCTDCGYHGLVDNMKECPNCKSKLEWVD